MSASWTEQDYFRLAEWGYGCYQQGDLARARIIFSALLEARPHDAYAARGLAGVALQQGQPEEAVAVMASIVTRSPRNVPALLRLVEALIAASRFGEAHEGLTRLAGVIANEDRLRLDRLRRNAISATFFPWAEAHSSRDKKVAAMASSAVLRPSAPLRMQVRPARRLSSP